MPAHPIVHVELSAKDPAASSKFYESVFGWKIEHDPTFNYYQFRGEGGPGGGWVEVGQQSIKAGDAVIYIATDDIEASLKQVEKAGGAVLMPKQEIPGVGWFAHFTDPAGNRIGLFKDVNPQR